MDVTPLINENKKIIQSYGGGFFKINNLVFNDIIYLTPDDVIVLDLPKNIQELNINHFDFLSNNNFEQIILFGSNVQSFNFNQDLRYKLNKNNINLQFMDTGAACRTYNVLLAENRLISAILYPL